MVCTRLDVSYALSATSRYQANLGESHWTAVKSILKYLRKTKDMFLVYGGEDDLVIKGYTDASFQTNRDNFHSQSGYVFILNGCAVSWKSSKQETLVVSTTEAEYLAASEASKEGVWIRDFITPLGVWFQTRQTRWTSIVIIVVPSHRPGSQGITRNPST